MLLESRQRGNCWRLTSSMASPGSTVVSSTMGAPTLTSRICPGGSLFFGEMQGLGEFPGGQLGGQLGLPPWG